MYVLYLEYCLLLCRFDLLKLVFLLVVYGINDLLSLFKLCCVNVDGYRRISTINCGSDNETCAAVIIKVKVCFVYANEVYVSVKTAVEGKVSHLRINGLVGGVVNNNSNVGLIGKLVGKIDSPGGITAVVVSNLLACYVYVCGGVGAADLEVVSVSLGEICLLECLYIEAGAAEIVVSAVLTVGSVPCVRKADDFALTNAYVGRVFGKKPKTRPT